MAVVISNYSVVALGSAINSLYPGGMPAFRKNCPNQTFCTDGQLVRVAFMTQRDAESFISQLEESGINTIQDNRAQDVTLVNAEDGLMCDCEWIELGHFRGKMGAWLIGEKPEPLCALPGEIESSSKALTPKELRDSYSFVGTRENVDVYSHKKTGDLIYVGRTISGVPPAHINPMETEDRFNSLLEELISLGAFGQQPTSEYQGTVESVYERTKQLVKDTGSEAPGPLQIHGIASRLMGKWDEAEESFRRFTELCPVNEDGWLELTWALGAQNRLEEAESSARKAVDIDPNSAEALGNLASVLLQRGKTAYAYASAQRALESAPDNAKNQTIMAQIREADPSVVPWWKRILGG
jgi:tetratricopeptide (TPR) repeat protein